MKTTYNTSAPTQHAPAEGIAPGTGRDFITPDGHLVPWALGEAGIRQRTAMLVGGMLVGFWPDHV